ncbi:hypothetical protein EHE21_14445 [Proteus sp. GOKU]|uniref:hypothetical protein n=1 Tax=Proteus TaxID=583 RepID=UPI001892C14F|nr:MULTISPECIES: hypothetical protein [Proteus]QPB80506.1 hypothetical protein EHE21_14445 [Proteus sp. GOKU]QQP26513.1 hypothetical protein D7029_14445 [Proteus vulgaris]
MNIEKISSILKENDWCDMEICGFHKNDLIVKGCLDITDQNYFIELKFGNASYIDAPLSWTIDTTNGKFIKVTDRIHFIEHLPNYQKYFHLGGKYSFSFLAEFFSSKEWVHIIADSIEYKIIVQG